MMKNLKTLGTAHIKTGGKGNRFDDTELVLKVARDCFERYGVEKTRLEDVAKAVGISRPLLYKLFDGRQGLIDAVVDYELKKLVDQQAAIMKKHKYFKQVLIEGAMAGIEMARRDKVWMELLIHSSFDYLPAVMLDNAKAAHQLTLSVWQPYFDQARTTGELPTHVSDHDLMEWLMGIQYLFLVREEVSLERIRELLNTFVCPILNPIDPAQ